MIQRNAVFFYVPIISNITNQNTCYDSLNTPLLVPAALVPSIRIHVVLLGTIDKG